jgi:hypothetical protein
MTPEELAMVDLQERVPAWTSAEGKQVWKQYYVYKRVPEARCFCFETDDGSSIEQDPWMQTR